MDFFKNLFNFDRMITPILIKILYYIGLGLAVLGGIFTFFGGIIGGITNGSVGQVFGALIGGPLVIVLGVLFARLYAELLILAFQINESLTDIKEHLKSK